jgi:transcriptional regulator with XRE-family HTH domain
MSPSEYAAINRQIRNRRQLTREDVAREFDVTVGAQGNWENARHRPIQAQCRRNELLVRNLGLIQSPAREGGQ